MKIETTKVSRFKRKSFWFKVAGVLVAISIIFNWGSATAKVDLGDKKVSYDELVKEISIKKQAVKNVQSKVDDIDQQYNDKKAEFDSAMEIVNNKKQAEDDLATVNTTIKTKQDQVKSLDSQISAKQTELASVTGQIIEKKSAPIILPAGKFTVGKDLPAGRYKAVPVSGNGNFFVNDGADANVMLGKGELFVPEYVFDANDGDKIEITLSVKFIPVK